MNLNLVLLSLTALLLFQGPPLWSQEKTSDKETSVKSQKQTFDKIVAFYKKAFPEGNFKYREFLWNFTPYRRFRRMIMWLIKSN